MNCLICNNQDKIKKFSDYKLEIKSDEKYFKNCSIYNCSDCDFGFVYPFPSNENLNYFYQNIYRAADRPPFWRTENIVLQFYRNTKLQFYSSTGTEKTKQKHN